MEEAEVGVIRIVEHRFRDHEAVRRPIVGYRISATCIVYPAHHEHVIEITSGAMPDEKKIARQQRRAPPIHLVDGRDGPIVHVLLEREDFGELADIRRGERVQQPEIVRFDIVGEQPCIAQDRDGQRPTDIACITGLDTINLLRDTSAIL